MKTSVKLKIQLYGSFDCRRADGRPVFISSAKNRALLAMLAVAPGGVHSRKWLQEHLWGLSGEKHGRASLRRALTDFRKLLGDDFDQLIEASYIEVRLKTEQIELVSSPQDGVFLDGINVTEPLFSKWLLQKREIGQNNLIYLDSESRLALSPSVAVLPFIAVNGTAKENHFGDLIAMDAARSLSRSKLIDVISHLSSRRLAGRSIDLADLKTKLNADYAISGNVRVDGDRYRLEADFIQTSSGRLLWTESFSGDLAEILQGESPMVARIASQCGQEVLRASVELARSNPLPDVAAHALFMASISEMHQHQLSSFAAARRNLEELIERMPSQSKLLAWLAKWYILAIAQGWSNDVAVDRQVSADLTARALDMNPECATSLTVDGMIQGDRGDDMSLSMARFQQATEIDPNHGLAWLMFSRMNSFLSNGSRAVELAQKARRLSPIDPHKYFYDIMESMAHTVDGNFERAVELAQQSLAANPRHISSYRSLAFAQQLAGHGAAAQQTVKTLLKLEPNLTVDSYLATHPAGHLAIGQTWAEALRDAGIPQRH